MPSVYTRYPHNCIICGKLMKTREYDARAFSNIAHNICKSIMWQYRIGRFKSYYGLLRTNQLMDNFGIPIGRFPCNYVMDTIKRKNRIARYRGYSK